MLDAVLDDPGLTVRPTVAEVDLSALRSNLSAIRAHVGPRRRVMGVVKANGYGHGLIRSAQTLVAEGVDALGVAFLEEAICLRRAEVKAPILVLGGIIGNQIVHFLEHDLEFCASSIHKLEQIDEAAAARGTRAKVHLKVDTGMERIGIHWDHAGRLFEAVLAKKNIDVCGVFSHFASAESPDPQHTKRQLERFLEALRFFEDHDLPTPTRHIANSGAILQHPDSWLDMVRPGIALYGVYPGPDVQRTVELRPALSLKTRVVYFKVVRAHDPVGYGSLWAPQTDTRLVTLPVGYGDGYSRALAMKAEVLLGGQRHPIVGAIAMDAMTVDIGAGSAYNGDEVVLIGRQGDEEVTIEELAQRGGTIPYEVLTQIAQRVPRRYLS